MDDDFEELCLDCMMAEAMVKFLQKAFYEFAAGSMPDKLELTRFVENYLMERGDNHESQPTNKW